MKRPISALLSLCIVGGVIPAIPQYEPESIIAADETDYEVVVYRFLKYHVYSDHAELVESNKYAEGDFIIPSEINGVPVTKISDKACYGCDHLTSVSIPDTVTSIGKMAFWDCMGLTSITIPDSVTSIDVAAFFGCRNLESITIPDSVTSIRYQAFELTKWLENQRKMSSLAIANNILLDGTTCSGDIIVPDSITSIGDLSFCGSDITSISLPDSVTSIGDSAFKDCTSLRSVSIPNSVTSIGNSAFETCINLKSIKIPDSIKSIGNNAFFFCSSLTSVTIPDSVTSIKPYTFGRCESLESITLPDSVTSIEEGAFSNCICLKSITIPESVKSIGESAFSNCMDLTSITIMNPYCKISNSSTTIYSSVPHFPFFDGTIYGYAGSTAQTYAEKFGCKFEPLPGNSILRGDANLDGNVNIADAVLVIQVATNPDKYAQGKSEFSITAQGEINADVDGKAGLTNEDALLIQKFKLGLIKEF